MNDQWLKHGRRWNSAERARIARRFRHHVRTPSNPKGRIHREACFWHPDIEAEAHHLDYRRPWRVVWVGLTCGCHRKLDHGSLKAPAKAVYDYTSLVEAPGVGRPGGRRHGPVRASKACTCGRRRKREVEKDIHRAGCPRDNLDKPPF